MKDQQLQRMDECVQQAASSINQIKVKYCNVQKETSMNAMAECNRTIDELRQQIECSEVKIEEYQVSLIVTWEGEVGKLIFKKFKNNCISFC